MSDKILLALLTGKIKHAYIGGAGTGGMGSVDSSGVKPSGFVLRDSAAAAAGGAPKKRTRYGSNASTATGRQALKARVSIGSAQGRGVRTGGAKLRGGKLTVQGGTGKKAVASMTAGATSSPPGEGKAKHNSVIKLAQQAPGQMTQDQDKRMTVVPGTPLWKSAPAFHKKRYYAQDSQSRTPLGRGMRRAAGAAGTALKHTGKVLDQLPPVGPSGLAASTARVPLKAATKYLARRGAHAVSPAVRSQARVAAGVVAHGVKRAPLRAARKLADKPSAAAKAQYRIRGSRKTLKAQRAARRNPPPPPPTRTDLVPDIKRAGQLLGGPVKRMGAAVKRAVKKTEVGEKVVNAVGESRAVAEAAKASLDRVSGKRLAKELGRKLFKGRGTTLRRLEMTGNKEQRAVAAKANARFREFHKGRTTKSAVSKEGVHIPAGTRNSTNPADAYAAARDSAKDAVGVADKSTQKQVAEALRKGKVKLPPKNAPEGAGDIVEDAAEGAIKAEKAAPKGWLATRKAAQEAKKAARTASDARIKEESRRAGGQVERAYSELLGKHEAAGAAARKVPDVAVRGPKAAIGRPQQEALRKTLADKAQRTRVLVNEAPAGPLHPWHGRGSRMMYRGMGAYAATKTQTAKDAKRNAGEAAQLAANKAKSALGVVTTKNRRERSLAKLKKPLVDKAAKLTSNKQGVLPSDAKLRTKGREIYTAGKAVSKDAAQQAGDLYRGASQGVEDATRVKPLSPWEKLQREGGGKKVFLPGKRKIRSRK